MSTRNHGGVSRQARGYDRDYDGAKRQLVAAAKRGEPYACTLRLAGCTEIATTPHHTDDGRLAPACAHCNYADGARRSRDGQRDLDASFGTYRQSDV